MTTDYPFNLIRTDADGSLPDPALRRRRPGVIAARSLTAEAALFIPGERLVTAMNAAIAVAEPLLITGEPGTGKTQAAYYAAHRLGTEVCHFQVKSETTARELLYHFDTVRYFHDAHLVQTRGETAPLDKADYVEHRALWEAFDDGRAQGRPAVLLIDEIDKAPRDFPNDLLHELDQMEFLVVLALAMGVERRRLEQALRDQDPSRLPYLGALLKDHKDLEETAGGGAGRGP